MEFEFENKKLECLYVEEKGAKKYPSDIVDSFFELMAVISSAPDESEFRKLKYLHFEKLTHSLTDRSMRLKGRWRLIIELRDTASGRTVVIKEISNHYGD